MKAFFSFFSQSGLHKIKIKENAKCAIKQYIASNIFCSSDVLDFVLDLFVRCRLYFLLKYFNNNTQRAGAVLKCKKNRKASKVMNV